MSVNATQRDTERERERVREREREREKHTVPVRRTPERSLKFGKS
jgi:hypothetical protein